MKTAGNRPPATSAAQPKPRESKRAGRAREPRRPKNGVRESILSLDRSFLADPARVARYCRAIFEYVAQEEKRYVMEPGILDKQPEVTRVVRAFIVETFVRWAFYFRYRQETVFLAVYFLDRVLSLRRLHRKSLQLFTATVLFIAAKFEEVRLISLRSFLKHVAEAHTAREVLQLESEVVALLDFRLTTVSPFDFLKRTYHATAAPESYYPFSCYLLESFLFDEQNSCFAASEKAVAAFLLTARLCRIRFDGDRLRRYLRFDEERVARVKKRMVATLSFMELNGFHGLSVKYRDNEFVQKCITAEYLKVKDL